MFSLFGTKFVKLYSGPMWRVESTSQEDLISSSRIPVEVGILDQCGDPSLQSKVFLLS